MPYKPFGAASALVCALTLALVLTPGSSSAQGTGSVDALDVALTYLDKNAGDHGVTPADVADLAVTSSYRSSHNGVTHVNLNQRFEDREVFGGNVTVNVTRNGGVLFAAGSLVPELAAAPSGSADLKPTDAVEAAADRLNLEKPEDLQVLGTQDGATLVSDGGISNAPIPARLGWQPTDRGLRLAWQLTIDDSSSEHLWNATVDAETGATLDVADWTSHESVVTPNPVDDGSSYRVFELPKESPNDGLRTLVQNPADAFASPFGWHDTDGDIAPDFTNARGVNAHAYLDQDDNNAADFGEPDVGTGLDFDFPLDLDEHAQNYRESAVTNLFYWNNTIHDVTYQYGFDEASGNFQANNYARGGTAGDYVRAEAADGSGTNNANFSTPIETATSAGTPRMQMYLWPGNQFGAQNQVVVPGVGSFDSSWARFSPAPMVGGTSGQLINAGNGCVAADYAGAPAGDWIAIVTGSNLGCQNVAKARQAGTSGAKALIVALNAGGDAPILTGALTTAAPTIPVASITQADGNTIRAAIAAGPTTGTVRKHPNHPGIRDGDLENGIIIHEYGHGVSNRLTGGPAVNCLTGNEQAGEGWSDWLAITMLLDPALDDPNVPRGMGPYALFQPNRQGAGIRPRPYTRNMAIQPFTYDSIKTGGWLDGTTLALPHGLGHGWAAVLWDLDWDLVDKYGFNPNVYGDWDSGGNNRAFQYVLDGLKMQGCGPGLVVASRAIVAATEALGGADTCTAWATFARRGLGFSAQQGTTGRDDNNEAFDTHPNCRRGFVGISDQPAITTVNRGSTVEMEFDAGGNLGLDLLASDSPYSRQVDCTTLRTVTPGAQFITPRPLPIPAETPGNSRLSYDPSTGRYTFPWKTDQAWGGTCREFVLTRDDGVQHRAYFRIQANPAYLLSGRVLDDGGQPVANATVIARGPIFEQTTSGANGVYSFGELPRGTYETTAASGGCFSPLTKTVDLSRPRVVDFNLPRRSDAFGYTCGLEAAPFDEAATVIPVSGDDTAGTIDLPFPFTFYGFPYTRAHVCTNGFVEFVGPASTNCSVTNAAIPTTGRPNGAIYSFWDDTFVDAQASIRTETKGAAPNRRFVIEFRNLHFFQDTGRRVDFNIVLHENGQIVTQYRNLAADNRETGGEATIGIENHLGNDALRFSFDEAVLGSEPAVTSIRYRPPPLPASHPVSGTVRDDDNQPIANANVAIEDTPITPATTDQNGRYTFPLVPEGTYDATASAGGCRSTETKQLVVSGPATLDFTLADATDSFGYSCELTTDAAFEEADTVLALTGDDASTQIALPFPFTLYGTTYTDARVCTNGWIELGTTAALCTFTNTALPTTARPNGAVYGYWDDLFVDAEASVRTQLKGTAPNRRFVIEYRNVRYLGDTTRRIDVSIVLDESGRILTQTRNIANDGRERGDSATFGIENAAGNVALQFSFNTAVLGTEPAVNTITYRPPA
jgi:hypothetical protein